MTLVIDIDDTLIKTETTKCNCGRPLYSGAKIINTEVELLRACHKSGHTIILHTGRNWDQYAITIDQLKEFEIPFHELVMGKPQGAYIDRDSYKSLHEFLNKGESNAD